MQAVNTREIEEVRNKGVLNSTDLQIIDNFVAEAVEELVNTKDFTSIARVRTVILARKNSNRDNQAQYAEQFSESAYKYISLGFEQASRLTPQERKFKAILNLLILVDNLEDLRLINLGRGMLNHDNAVIRYWAVHSVTNPGIIRQLNSNASSKLASEIAVQLKGVVEEANSETIPLMAEFAAKVQQALQQQLGLAVGVRIDIERQPQFQEEWRRVQAQLDSQYLKLLDEYKQELLAIT